MRAIGNLCGNAQAEGIMTSLKVEEVCLAYRA